MLRNEREVKSEAAAARSSDPSGNWDLEALAGLMPMLAVLCCATGEKRNFQEEKKCSKSNQLRNNCPRKRKAHEQRRMWRVENLR